MPKGDQYGGVTWLRNLQLSLSEEILILFGEAKPNVSFEQSPEDALWMACLLILAIRVPIACHTMHRLNWEVQPRASYGLRAITGRLACYRCFEQCIQGCGRAMLVAQTWSTVLNNAAHVALANRFLIAHGKLLPLALAFEPPLHEAGN